MPFGYSVDPDMASLHGGWETIPFFIPLIYPSNFNLSLNFTPSEMEDLLTKERITSTTEMILKVKKPDYLGESMWDFRYASRQIPVKISDENWLSDFQHRKIDIRPGDSIRASVLTTAKYGYDMEVLGHSYEILKVIEIIPLNNPRQGAIELDT